MGLRTFTGDSPTSKDIEIAKNYLDENELKVLNNLVSGYFDFAEIQAIRKKPMYMKDYIEHLDNILKSTEEDLLENSGTVSHEQAIKKARDEYKKYQSKTITPVEQEYLEMIRDTEKIVKKKIKE